MHQFAGEGGGWSIDISNESKVKQIESLEQAAEIKMGAKLDSETKNGLSMKPKASNAFPSSKFKPSKPVETDEKVMECPICGDVATKYRHYGARSCQPCRAFFRRSVIRFDKTPR